MKLRSASPEDLVGYTRLNLQICGQTCFAVSKGYRKSLASSSKCVLGTLASFDSIMVEVESARICKTIIT